MSQSNSLPSTPSSSASSPASPSPQPPTTINPLSDPPPATSPSPSPSPSPPPRPQQPTHPHHNPNQRAPHRPATLYDAVAGRITTSGFLTPHPQAPTTGPAPAHAHAHAHSHVPARTRARAYASRHRDTASSSLVPLPPEEVLFRRRRAPVRYLDGEGEGEGGDWYFADERELGGGCRGRGELPGEGLVKGVAGYVAGFYGVLSEGGLGEDKGKWGGGDWRSMDETALLAVGVLLEEEVGRVLGGSGDLVFVEGEGVGGVEAGREMGKREMEREEKRMRERKRKRKRRKVGGGEGGGEVVGMATGVEEGG